jgi:hypothetical protein
VWAAEAAGVRDKEGAESARMELLILTIIGSFAYLNGVERLCQGVLLAELEDDLDHTAFGHVYGNDGWHIVWVGIK